MAMRQGLELRQTQRLAMTPQLRQSIGMLRMSLPELQAHLAEEIEKNPVLRAEAPVEEAASGSAAAADPQAAPHAGEARDRRAREGASLVAPAEASDALAGVAARTSLAEHVRAQLGCAALDDETRAVADMLCGDLDEDGYLRVDPAEAAARLGARPRAVAEAVAAIRDCDPTGVGAADLADCLRLQLAEAGALDDATRALLDRLDELPRRRPDALAALCGVTPEALAEALARLRRLDPRPGARHAPAEAAPSAPDVVVARDAQGAWRVALNDAAFPRLSVDGDYVARIGGAARGAARDYLADCAREARWLRRSLDQRARTVLAVAAVIVERQSGFMERGAARLRPMTLRDVAEAAELHESTVSRAVANKTMATPRGVVAMRSFFTAALGGEEGSGAAAAGAVRERIRALVAAEPPGAPLSDDALVKALKAEGVAVARRTVAKYREALGLPSSFERRRRAAATVSVY